MPLRVLGSRAVRFLSKSNGRPLCSVATSSAPKEPLSSASPEPDVSSTKPGWNFLKFAIVGSLTGATAAAGYASYAYSLDDVERKTKSLRESVKYSAGENATALDKFQQLLYSTAMTVPAKAIELYLDARRLVEEQVQSYTEPYSDKLLPDLLPQEQHVSTLVLDLNETLIHYIWT